MSLFTWFTDRQASSGPEHKRAPDSRRRPAGTDSHRALHDGASPAEESKLRRHARREQLYIAIREAMTRAGVLSASYKFKVLSLDQRGNEYLVMLDLIRAFPGPVEHLAEIESLIVQNALARFEIAVSAVYWRMDAASALKKPPAPAQEPARAAPQSEAVSAARALVKSGKHTEPSRYDPIQPDEVTAFKQALLAASAQEMPTGSAKKGVKLRSGPRSEQLQKGFEDTVLRDSEPSPALSSTQYGDLN